MITAAGPLATTEEHDFTVLEFLLWEAVVVLIAFAILGGLYLWAGRRR